MMKKLFEKYDKSETGFMSIEELRTMANTADGKQVGQIPEGILEELFAGIDENHDGKISLEEMSTFMREKNYHLCLSEPGYAELMDAMGLEGHG